jgi:hypothetical protein
VNLTQQQILQIAHDLFMRFGFKAVTVDDIAKQAGISKKTLYENYTDKDNIVYAVLNFIDNCMNEEQCGISKNSENAIEEAIEHMVMLETILNSMNANCLPDLQKYYPKAFLEFKKNKDAQMKSVEQNIKRGMKEGYYRKNLNVAFCAWYRIDNIMYMLQNGELAKRFDPIASQIELMQHFLYGISTLKGHELIEQYITKFKKKK